MTDPIRYTKPVEEKPILYRNETNKHFSEPISCNTNFEGEHYPYKHRSQDHWDAFGENIGNVTVTVSTTDFYPRAEQNKYQDFTVEELTAIDLYFVEKGVDLEELERQVSSYAKVSEVVKGFAHAYVDINEKEPDISLDQQKKLARRFAGLISEAHPFPEISWLLNGNEKNLSPISEPVAPEQEAEEGIEVTTDDFASILKNALENISKTPKGRD